MGRDVMLGPLADPSSTLSIDNTRASSGMGVAASGIFVARGAADGTGETTMEHQQGPNPKPTQHYHAERGLPPSSCHNHLPEFPCRCLLYFTWQSEMRLPFRQVHACQSAEGDRPPSEHQT
jgi:hypothetical protein